MLGFPGYPGVDMKGEGGGRGFAIKNSGREGMTPPSFGWGLEGQHDTEATFICVLCKKNKHNSLSLNQVIR